MSSQLSHSMKRSARSRRRASPAKQKVLVIHQILAADHVVQRPCRVRGLRRLCRSTMSSAGSRGPTDDELVKTIRPTRSGLAVSAEQAWSAWAARSRSTELYSSDSGAFSVSIDQRSSSTAMDAAFSASSSFRLRPAAAPTLAGHPVLSQPPSRSRAIARSVRT